jgi:gliding motility-associated-like protein
VYGNVHLFGQTSAPANELIANANYHDTLGGQFIVKLKPQLDSIIWATRFGRGDGTPDISPTAFLVDVCSAIYLSGWGSVVLSGTSLTTNGLDTIGNPYQGTTDDHDFYVMVISDDGNSLMYATYFGGTSREHVDGGTSRFDRKGKVYQAVCAGCGGLSDFPTAPNPGAYSNSNNAPGVGCNLAVFKMDFLLPIVIADFDVPTSGCAPFSVTFDNLSIQQSSTKFLWDFGDGTTASTFEPSHTYNNAGVYTVKLLVTDAATCNLGDSVTLEITVLNNTNSNLPDAISCDGLGTDIGVPQNNDPNLNLTWIPSTYLSDTLISNPFANPPINTQYQLIVDNGVCFDTLVQNVVIDSIKIEITGDSAVCSVNAPFLLGSTVFGTPSSYHWSNYGNFSDTLNSDSTDNFVFITPPDSVNYYFAEVTSLKGCKGIDTFLIRQKDVQNPVKASFSEPGSGCAPYTVNFQNTTDSTAITTYYWDLGNGITSTLSNPNTVYTTKGIYTATLISYDTSICSQIDTFSLQIVVREDSNYTVSHLACSGQDTEIGIPADTTTGTTYTWIPTNGLSNPTINNPEVNITQSTTYLLVVQHVCTDSVTNTVTVEPISANTDSIIIICSDNPTVDLKGNSNGTGINFVWSSSANFTDTLNTNLNDSTLRVTQTNTYQHYYLQVESALGCFETDSSLSVISDQTITTSPDSFICQNDTLLLHAINGYPYNAMDFFWSPASDIIGQTDTSTITIAPLKNTTYYVSAINDSGCVFMDTLEVEVSLLNAQSIIATTDDDSLILGLSTTLRATPSTGFNYSWIPNANLDTPNQSTTIASPEITTTYTVFVTDPKNSSCSYKNEVEVVVFEVNCGEPDIFIPNAFSPNLDGEHDIYRISGNVIQTMELQIYNRWGELVFESNDVNKGWDGTFNGKQVDPTVFVYQLKVVCIDNKEYSTKGNITIVR